MSVAFEFSDVLPLFPTFVWKSQLSAAVYRPIDQQLRAVLAQLCGEELAPGQSWQSRQDLHELEEFAGMLSYVQEATRGVLEFLRIRNQPFEVTGCWLNVYAPGAVHPMHSHPNNYLSGVYYVQAQAGADTINFHDPRVQAAVVRPPVAELTAGNADQAVIRVGEGTLLLFPAWLMHSVDANSSSQRRISVSFNIMFSAYTATMSRPMWTSGVRRRPRCAAEPT